MWGSTRVLLEELVCFGNVIVDEPTTDFGGDGRRVKVATRPARYVLYWWACLLACVLASERRGINECEVVLSLNRQRYGTVGVVWRRERSLHCNVHAQRIHNGCQSTPACIMCAVRTPAAAIYQVVAERGKIIRDASGLG